MNSFIAAIVALFGFGSGYAGECRSFGSPTVSCTYGHDGGSPQLTDALMRVAGKELMLGPWAKIIDITHPSITTLAGKSPIALNLRIFGAGLRIPKGQENGLIANITIIVGAPSAVVTIEGNGGLKP